MKRAASQLRTWTWGATAAVLFGVGAVGCGLLDDAGNSLPEPGVCGDAVDTAQAAGRWRLRGEAERRGCGDESLNSDNVKLESDELTFSQQGSTLTFTGPKTAPGISGRVVTGSVNLCEVFVGIRETTPDGLVELELSGVATGGTITGDIDGEGPGSCRLSGRFSAEVDPPTGSP